jgi:hypothetical protein
LTTSAPSPFGVSASPSTTCSGLTKDSERPGRTARGCSSWGRTAKRRAARSAAAEEGRPPVPPNSRPASTWAPQMAAVLFDGKGGNLLNGCLVHRGPGAATLRKIA